MNQLSPMMKKTRPASGKLDIAAHALPKINVPPPRGTITPLAEMSALSSESTHPSPNDSKKSASVSQPATSIRWDGRFALSLIALLVAVNVTLVWLFAKPAPSTPGFITQLAPQQMTATLSNRAVKDGALNRLAPAAGSAQALPRSTTTYISTDERKTLLEQLQRTRQPGMVSVPPASTPAP